MKKLYLYAIVTASCMLMSVQLSSQVNTFKDSQIPIIEECAFILRPNLNLGFLENKLTYSAGLRVLLQAGENKSYGIEISRYKVGYSGQSFYTAGVILEQSLFNWFNMSIGTIGYYNFDNESRNTVGLVSNLGWEPMSKRRVSPYLTYRSDLIFASKIQTINSLNIGLNIKFFKSSR